MPANATLQPSAIAGNRAPRDVSPDELAALLGGTPLLLLLDVDGTLCEIVSDPNAARVPDATRRTLARLTAAPGVHVVLVTGRAIRDARRMVGVASVPIVGNHGLERTDATGAVRPADGWDAVAPTVRRAHHDLAPIVARVAGASLEDKDFSLTVHYRGVDAASVPTLKRDVTALATRLGLRVADGKCVLNIVPPIDMDKGAAALEIARDHDARAPSASILFAGDDVTDEDAFAALARHAPHAITVRVGTDDVPTAARYRIASPAALARALELIAERRGV